MVESMYLILNSILNTTFAGSFYLWMDQDVAFNPVKFVKDNDEQLPSDYDPNETQLDKKLPSNSDGSHNVMPEYYWYSRETIGKGFYKIFGSFFTWSIFCAFLSVYCTAYTMSGPISDGKTLDYWNNFLA